MIRAIAIVALLVSLAPRTALAQPFTPLELSGGYSAVNDPNDQVSLPVGWMAEGALTLTGWLSAVADVSGQHTTVDAFGSDLHLGVFAAMGGLRASRRLGRVTEFGQLLTGLVRSSSTAFGLTSATDALGLQPGLGIDYPLGGPLAARGELDVRFIHNQGDGNNSGHEYRFVAAIVYRRPR
jgi:hypothetical protein